MNVSTVNRIPSAEITAALVYRADMWHKATSHRVKPDYAKFTRSEVADGKKGKVVDKAKARAEAKTLTAIKRIEYWRKAVAASRALVDLLASGLPDNRPKPMDDFEYEGKQYVLQSVMGDTAVYVPMENYRFDQYVNQPTSHRERIEKELISQREGSAVDMLSSLVPPENVVNPDFS